MQLLEYIIKRRQKTIAKEIVDSAGGGACAPPFVTAHKRHAKAPQRFLDQPQLPVHCFHHVTGFEFSKYGWKQGTEWVAVRSSGV